MRKFIFILLSLAAALLLCGCSKMGRGQGRLTVTTLEQMRDVEIWVTPSIYYERRPTTQAPVPIEKRFLPRGETEVSFTLNDGDYLVSLDGYLPVAVQVVAGKESFAYIRGRL